MGTAHHRRKRPAEIRRALLDNAMQIAVDQGLGAVTVQAVAAASGVTKGGLLHHFPSKQALIDAVFSDLLDRFSEDLEERMRDDPVAPGRMTRAYLSSVLDLGADGGPTAALSILMLADAPLRQRWADWTEALISRHRATDDSVDLTLVRLAADGIWLSDLGAVPVPQRDKLLARLQSMASGTHEGG